MHTSKQIEENKMTVSEMINWLKTVPQDATIQVIYHTSGCNHYEQGGNVEIVDFKSDEATPENNWTTLFDYYESKDGKKTLILGSTGN